MRGACRIVAAWWIATSAGIVEGSAQVELNPEIVGAGVVSTAANQTFPAIDPVTGDLWFSEYTNSFADQTIRFSRWEGSGWLPPTTAPFSGTWGDRAPRFSPDGLSIYFTSSRPRPGEIATGDMNIWRVDRDGDGWGVPNLLPSPVNSADDDIHASVTDSAVWLASNREGSLGRSDLYRIGTDGSVTHFAAPLNDANSQPDVWAGRDESWLILAVTEHPRGFGGDDLWISGRSGDTWSVPINLGDAINTPEYEYGPSVSPDGEYLYFTSHRDGPSHVYRVPVASIRALLESRER